MLYTYSSIIANIRANSKLVLYVLSCISVKNSWFLTSKLGVAYRYLNLKAAGSSEARTPLTMWTLCNPVKKCMPSLHLRKHPLMLPVLQLSLNLHFQNHLFSLFYLCMQQKPEVLSTVID